MGTNGRVLTVHQAEVTTAAVGIKTLTIRGKQVTLAVFRQLKREFLIDTNARFRGLPWGVVNYHYSGCKPTDYYNGYYNAPDYSDHDHLHVVWQTGDELRQAIVLPPVKYHLREEAEGKWSLDGQYRSEEEIDAIIDRYNQEVRRWNELYDLPQLFIAV
jgi:hypothetical protein